MGTPQFVDGGLLPVLPLLDAIFVPGPGARVTTATGRVPVGSKLPALKVEAPMKMPTSGVGVGVKVGGGKVSVGRRLSFVAWTCGALGVAERTMVARDFGGA